MTNQAVFYWDLSERERAGLSRDEVERYVDAELMTKGVLKARPPKLEPEPKETVRLSQRFQVQSAAAEHWHTPKLLFVTEEAARTFLDLQPEHTHSSYTGEGHIEHGQAFSRTVTAVSIIAAEDYEANKSLLQSATSIRAANKKASEEYEKAVKAQDEALKGLWEDWSTQRQRDHKLRGVMATFEEYRRIAASQDVALRFLRKVHSVSQIEEAAEWCGVALPADWEFAEVEAAAMPAPASEMTSDETAAVVF
jgi:hypothetical protein